MKRSSFLKTLLGIAVAPKVLAEVVVPNKISNAGVATSDETSIDVEYITTNKNWARVGDMVMNQYGAIGLVLMVDRIKEKYTTYKIRAIRMDKGFKKGSTFKHCFTYRHE